MRRVLPPLPLTFCPVTSQEESRASKLELDALREQHVALQAQQQQLLDSLAQRDREVGCGLCGGCGV